MRRAAAGGQPALLQREAAEQERSGGQRQPRPQRPSMRPAVDQRQHDGGEAEGGQDRPGEVQPPSLTPGLRDHPRRRQHRHQADRDVDEKAAAPAQAERVGLDEDPADELARHGGEAHAHAVGGQRLGPIGAVVEDADDGQDVGHQQGGGAALKQPGDDQHLRRAGHPAPGGGEREQGQPGGEAPDAAHPVTQAGAGDEEHGVGEAVAGDDPFDRTRRRVQVGLHRRQRDVDDEEVQHDHEGAGEDHRQRQPAAASGGERRRGTPDGRYRLSAHGRHVPSRPSSRRLPAG